MAIGECGLRAVVRKSPDGQTVFTEVYCQKICGAPHQKRQVSHPDNVRIPVGELQEMADQALEPTRNQCIESFGLPEKSAGRRIPLNVKITRTQ